MIKVRIFIEKMYILEKSQIFSLNLFYVLGLDSQNLKSWNLPMKYYYNLNIV